MLSIVDDSILDEVVQEEVDTPSPRKVDGERTIYSSVELDIPDDPGEPIFCDFGDARVGQGPFEGEVMPDLYRAPEIVLRIPWDEKIDIWSFGLMVSGVSCTAASYDDLTIHLLTDMGLARRQASFQRTSAKPRRVERRTSGKDGLTTWAASKGLNGAFRICRHILQQRW